MAVPIRRIAAAALVAGCLTTPARAQRPEERPVTIYSDVLSGRGEFATVILAGGTAYRVEVTPGTAVFSIRPFQLGARPPMVTSTMENPVAGSGGASYLVVPAESGEYRIQVAADEAVRVRIVRDPREQALLEGRATTGWHILTIGLRAVVVPGSVAVSDGTTLNDLRGWEACVGIAEGSVPFARRLSGCAFTYAILKSAEGTEHTFYGVAPRYRLIRGRAAAVDVAAQIAFARQIETAGIGLNLRVTVTGPLALEAEPGIVWVRSDGYATPGGTGRTEVPAVTTVLPRLAAGFRVHF